MSLLLPLALIDLRTMRLPEPLCRWGVISGLVLSALAGCWLGLGTELLLWHAVAAATGLLIFEGISGLGENCLGPQRWFGDAKLAALLGAWLGLQGLAVPALLRWSWELPLVCRPAQRLVGSQATLSVWPFFGRRWAAELVGL